MAYIVCLSYHDLKFDLYSGYYSQYIEIKNYNIKIADLEYLHMCIHNMITETNSVFLVLPNNIKTYTQGYTNQKSERVSLSSGCIFMIRNFPKGCP